MVIISVRGSVDPRATECGQNGIGIRLYNVQIYRITLFASFTDTIFKIPTVDMCVELLEYQKKKPFTQICKNFMISAVSLRCYFTQ
jgi:hypothetical protein